MNNEREDKRAARMFKRAELRQEQKEELALRKLNYEAKTARLVWLSSAFSVMTELIVPRTVPLLRGPL